MSRKRVLIIIAVLIVGLGSLLFATKKTPTTSSVPETKLSYIALGDSVAAGQGLEMPSDSSACNRTDESYPNIVAGKLNMKLSSVACSGATIDKGVLGPQVVNGVTLEPQINKLSTGEKPKLVTVTVGANDVGWTSFVAKCFTGECGTSEDSADASAKQQSLGASLDRMLSEIQSKIPSTTKTLVTGYYQIYPEYKQWCSYPTSLTDDELLWLHGQTQNINKTISSSVAKYSFATFVPADYTGHELCTQTPWVQDFLASAPFHPTADGQSAIAESAAKLYK